jgi:putative addiction module component (TIGR02574 family)
VTERARIAHELIRSLDEEAPKEDLDQAWEDELARRADEIDSGTVKLEPWSKVRQELVGHRGREYEDLRQQGTTNAATTVALVGRDASESKGAGYGCRILSSGGSSRTSMQAAVTVAYPPIRPSCSTT